MHSSGQYPGKTEQRERERPRTAAIRKKLYAKAYSFCRNIYLSPFRFYRISCAYVIKIFPTEQFCLADKKGNIARRMVFLTITPWKIYIISITRFSSFSILDRSRIPSSEIVDLIRYVLRREKTLFCVTVRSRTTNHCDFSRMKRGWTRLKTRTELSSRNIF